MNFDSDIWVKLISIYLPLSWRWATRQRQDVLSREPVLSVVTFPVRRWGCFWKKHFEKWLFKYFIFQVTQPGLQGMCASGRFEQGSSTAWGWQEQQAQVGEILQNFIWIWQKSMFLNFFFKQEDACWAWDWWRHPQKRRSYHSVIPPSAPRSALSCNQ